MEAHDGGDEVVMDAGAREPEETRSRSVRQSTIVRRLLPLSAPPPLQLELEELTSDVGTEITFEEVHKESSKTRNWEGYPTMNAHLHKGSLRGFRKEANYVGNLLTCFRMHSRLSRSRLPSASSSPSSMSLLLGYQVPL